MGRTSRTPDEVWAIGKLLDALSACAAGWEEDLEAPSDKPDLVLRDNSGLRVACEITQVDRSEWFRWQNDRGLNLDMGELDQAAVPREVDLWLHSAVARKAPRVPEYLSNAAAPEAWLLLHGGLNKVFDFFNLVDDENYDIPLLVKAAEEIAHPFARIYVASSHSERIVKVFPYEGARHAPPDITDPEILRVGAVRSMSVQLGFGVTEVPIGGGYEPKRSRILPLLDPDRMQKN